MPPRDDEARIADIVLAARRVQRFIEGMTGEQFAGDERTIYAVLHSLLLIGEAASRLSLEFRERHESVPWPQIVSLRNRLVHEYFVIDSSIIWDITNIDLPHLLKVLEPLVNLDK